MQIVMATKEKILLWDFLLQKRVTACDILPECSEITDMVCRAYSLCTSITCHINVTRIGVL